MFGTVVKLITGAVICLTCTCDSFQGEGDGCVPSGRTSPLDDFSSGSACVPSAAI